MTPAQIDLLKRLIAADREYRTDVSLGKVVGPDDRGVEIGWINGVNPRTAEVLVEAGLAEVVHIRSSQNYIFLGAYSPYNERKDDE